MLVSEQELGYGKETEMKDGASASSQLCWLCQGDSAAITDANIYCAAVRGWLMHRCWQP